MDRSNEQARTDTFADETSETATREADAVRLARLRRNRALTPAERLDKLAALCREAALLSRARRIP